MRELWTRCRAGGDVRDHPLVGTDEVLARAVRLRDARAGGEFTEYDGDLSSCAIAPVDGPIAPTRVETWPACPHAYFVRYLLGVRPVEEPEDIVSVTALDKGSALHEAVHRLHQAVLDGDASRPGPAGWADEHVELLARFGADGRRRAGGGGTDRAAGVLGGRPARPAPRAGAVDRGRSGELAGPYRPALGGDVRPGRSPSPSRWRAGGRSPSRVRSTASTSCPTAPSSSPITRPAAPTTTPRSATTIRRWGARGSSSPSTPPRRVSCSSGRTPRCSPSTPSSRRRGSAGSRSPSTNTRGPWSSRTSAGSSWASRPASSRRSPIRRAISTTSGAGTASPTASGRANGGPSGSANATTSVLARWFPAPTEQPA